MRRASSTPPELPGYTFIKVLGSGGFSDVFLYEQKLPKRRVAVKVLLTEELSGANRAAFVAEANLMAQLSTHPYIVTIYQADVAGDDRPYFVMEYCSGPSLAERYKQEIFPVVDALRIGVRLSSAVATAHAAGILHRDIKPANVLTNDYGWPALTDFGISCAVEDEVLPIHTGTLDSALNDTGATGTGASIGMSVPWSPPEMFEDDPSPDVRSDIFSLSATIYTILAGQTPFEVRGRSNGTLDLIGRIERGAITPFSRDDIPRSLVAVLQKGMATDRASRFATTVDFARALQRVELELGYAPTTIDVPNILIEAPDRGGVDGDNDATRARSVSTIAIQEPLRPPIVAAVLSAPVRSAQSALDATLLRNPVRVSQPDALDKTVMRPRTLATPEPVTESTVDPPFKSAELRARHRAGLIVGIIVGAVVVAGIVAAAVIIPRSLQLASPHTTPSPNGGGIIDVSSVPDPVLVSAQPSADGTSVAFVWKNPKPKSGDSYYWARAETPDTNVPASEPQAVVTGLLPGSRACITISIVRSGVGSANPLRACSK